MPNPRFTKISIHYFLSQHKSISKRHGSYVNTIKDDGVLGRFKFVSKGEDYQVYRLDIPDMMLTNKIKQPEAYQTFISLSTGLIAPKKSRGKGSKETKAAVTPKKKSSITADDNIIPEPDVDFELGKSIRKAEVEIAEEARRVHETYERLVTEKAKSVEESNESDGEPANGIIARRRPNGVVFRDTSNVSKKKSMDESQKLKGIQIMTKEEQLAADTTQLRKTSILWSRPNARQVVHITPRRVATDWLMAVVPFRGGWGWGAADQLFCCGGTGGGVLGDGSKHEVAAIKQCGLCVVKGSAHEAALLSAYLRCEIGE
ncbi:hypothetical protein Tco_1107676 [Tanacetum coccineum]